MRKYLHRLHFVHLGIFGWSVATEVEAATVDLSLYAEDVIELFNEVLFERKRG